jgi:hypothetical protein
MTFDEWLAVGLNAGYASPSCDTHDGPALTDDERDRFDAGGDPCVPVLRVWPPA